MTSAHINRSPRGNEELINAAELARVRAPPAMVALYVTGLDSYAVAADRRKREPEPCVRQIIRFYIKR